MGQAMFPGAETSISVIPPRGWEVMSLVPAWGCSYVIKVPSVWPGTLGVHFPSVLWLPEVWGCTSPAHLIKNCCGQQQVERLEYHVYFNCNVFLLPSIYGLRFSFPLACGHIKLMSG